MIEGILTFVACGGLAILLAVRHTIKHDQAISQPRHEPDERDDYEAYRAWRGEWDQ